MVSLTTVLFFSISGVTTSSKYSKLSLHILKKFLKSWGSLNFKSLYKIFMAVFMPPLTPVLHPA